MSVLNAEKLIFQFELVSKTWGNLEPCSVTKNVWCQIYEKGLHSLINLDMKRVENPCFWSLLRLWTIIISLLSISGDHAIDFLFNARSILKPSFFT